MQVNFLNHVNTLVDFDNIGSLEKRAYICAKLQELQCPVELNIIRTNNFYSFSHKLQLQG